jgi:hypothetical protein
MSSRLVQLPSRTLDNSMLTTYERCPRLFHILYNRHLTPGSSPALDFGSLVHLGLNIWYTSFTVPGMTKDRAMEIALQAMLEADYVDPGEDFRTKERAILTFAEHCEYYGWMEQNHPNGWNWKVLFSETAFDSVDENGLPWGGKIDLCVEWRGDLWLVDHKTTSRKGDDYFYQFVPDTQTAGYVKYGSLLAGRRIKGVIINSIVVHKIKKPPAQQFERRSFEYPEYYLREFTEQQLTVLQQVAESERDNVWRPRWLNCMNKYGKCPAFYVCRSEPSNRERELSKWEERTWDFRAVENVEITP